MSASYLLRFDDICPTMNWEIWYRVEEILSANNIKPLMAVIPDNQDECLQFSPTNPAFWDHVRRWQQAGWAIGMHGYQHRYETADSGILGLNRFSEFAGLPYDEQEAKIRRSLEIFHGEQVWPKVWVAPGCSFDHNTLKALKKHGISIVSDGYFLFPHVDASEMMWVPHQIWRFRARPIGVWTVGLHHNWWADHDIRHFRRGVEAYKPSITCLEEVVQRYQHRHPGWFDNCFAWSYFRLMLVKSSILTAIRGRPGTGKRQ